MASRHIEQGRPGTAKDRLKLELFNINGRKQQRPNKAS